MTEYDVFYDYMNKLSKEVDQGVNALRRETLSARLDRGGVVISFVAGSRTRGEPKRHEKSMYVSFDQLRFLKSSPLEDHLALLRKDVRDAVEDEVRAI